MQKKSLFAQVLRGVQKKVHLKRMSPKITNKDGDSSTTFHQTAPFRPSTRGHDPQIWGVQRNFVPWTRIVMAGYLCKSLRIWFGNVPYLASTGFEAEIPQNFCLAARTRYIENHRNTCILYIYVHIHIHEFGASTLKKETKTRIFKPELQIFLFTFENKPY